jgi:hypothetical protein
MTLSNLPLFIHIGALTFAFAGILIADHSALDWMRGKTDVAHPAAVFSAHWVVSVGLAVVVLSGLWLFWPMRAYLLTQPLFWIKMGFVAALLINSLFIEAFMHRATRYAFRDLTFRQKLPLLLSGAVSTLSWLGAGVTALVMFS